MSLTTLPERPRIACLITNSEIGGAQTHVADLLGALRQRADVTLLAGGNGPLFDVARDLDVRAVRLSRLDNALSPFKAVAALSELIAALRTIAPDLIHTHSAKASALGRLAGRILRVPVVYTVHGFAFKPAAPWPQRTVARLAEWLLAPFTSHFICVAAAERHLASHLPIRPDRISVIRNGIADVSVRANPGAPMRRVVTVMRLSAPKRPDVLIRAFSAAQLPGCELVIAGDGSQRQAMEQLALQLAPGRIRFAGNIDDIPALLADSQAFLLASEHEGFPISILEAMRAGLPVIATDLPGIREQLGGGQCGVLVEGNDPQAFARELTRAAIDADRRIVLGQAARARWEAEYGLDQMVRDTWAVYRKAIDADRPLDKRVTAS